MNQSDTWHLTAPKPEKLPPPLERKSQAAVIDWARWASGQWPELRYLFAVPNGLWLKGLPKLRPTSIVDGRKPRVHHMPPSPNRWKDRSRTYTGIAAAMAEQWG